MSFKENEPRENTTQEEKKRGAGKKSTAVIILLLLLVLVMGAILIILLFKKTPEGIVLDPMSGKYEAPVEISEETDPEYIRLPGLAEIYIEQGKDTANSALWNPDSNPCYFQYTIVLKDTEDQIYQSGMIAPGDAVTKVQFNRTFTQGIYPIVIKIASFDLTDPEKSMNGGEINAELIVMVQPDSQ